MEVAKSWISNVTASTEVEQLRAKREDLKRIVHPLLTPNYNISTDHPLGNNHKDHFAIYTE